MKHQPLLIILLSAFFVWFSCDDTDEFKQEITGSFQAVESPFTIHAENNPAGVGIDFVYREAPGGANYMNEISVTDFQADIIIKALTVESIEGGIKTVPYVELYGDTDHMSNAALAYNYSAYDSSMVGYQAYLDLKKEDAKTGIEHADRGPVNVAKIDKGDSGYPLESKFMIELKKLVIADHWHEAAANNQTDDAPVWVIKTRDNAYVKLIFLEYKPLNETGSKARIQLEWTWFGENAF